MPLVRISHRAGVSEAYRQALSDGVQEALYRRIVANFAANLGLRPEDVLICLVGNELADWSFGLGEAQYVH